MKCPCFLAPTSMKVDQRSPDIDWSVWKRQNVRDCNSVWIHNRWVWFVKGRSDVQARAAWQRPACSLFQAGSSLLFFFPFPSTTSAPASASLPTDGRPHPQQLAVIQGERACQSAVTEVCCAACAGRSKLTAIVCGVLATALLIAAVVVALVCFKKSKMDKYTSKR